MSTVHLQGFHPGPNGWMRFQLTLDTGEVLSSEVESESAAQRGCSGIGCFVSIGSWWSKRSCFAALYVRAGSLFFCIDGREISVDADTTISVDDHPFRLSVFRVEFNGQVVCTTSYLPWGRMSFPSSDFFDHVARSVADEQSRIRTLLIWSDIATNQWQPSDEYFSQLGQRVTARLKH